MSDIHINPDHLAKSGGTLEDLGRKLHAGGDKLTAAGERLSRSASGDKTGIGAVLTQFFGKATEIGGKVISEGGRVAEKSGQNLKETARTVQEVDRHYHGRFTGMHRDHTGPQAVHGGGTTRAAGAGGGGAKVHEPPTTGHGGGSAPPGAHDAGGGSVHQPPMPPGGGGGVPGGGGSGGGRDLGPSWRDEWDKHFTPGERQELEHAMRKVSEEPNDRGVPGSGRLTQHERELFARAQSHVEIDSGTPMQKVIPPHDVQKYLDGKYDTVGGFVARQQDAAHLDTPDALVRGNRLDYGNSPYHPGMDRVHVIEFPATDPEWYKTPLGAPSAGDHGALETDPSVRYYSDKMHDAAHAVGLDPNTYHRSNNEWPYTGVGVTADPAGVPEREMPERQPLPAGSRMVEYDRNGNRIITHVFRADQGWVPAP